MSSNQKGRRSVQDLAKQFEQYGLKETQASSLCDVQSNSLGKLKENPFLKQDKKLKSQEDTSLFGKTQPVQKEANQSSHIADMQRRLKEKQDKKAFMNPLRKISEENEQFKHDGGQGIDNPNQFQSIKNRFEKGLATSEKAASFSGTNAFHNATQMQRAGISPKTQYKPNVKQQTYSQKQDLKNALEKGKSKNVESEVQPFGQMKQKVQLVEQQQSPQLHKNVIETESPMSPQEKRQKATELDNMLKVQLQNRNQKQQRPILSESKPMKANTFPPNRPPGIDNSELRQILEQRNCEGAAAEESKEIVLQGTGQGKDLEEDWKQYRSTKHEFLEIEKTVQNNKKAQKTRSRPTHTF